MPVATTVVGLITAIATGVTALGGLIVALTVLVPILRKTRQLEKKTDEVHVLVNQRFTDMERWNRSLVNALRRAGVEVPEDQSKILEGPKG